MRRKVSAGRVPEIKVGFDFRTLNDHVAAADKARALTQDELAQAYATKAEVAGLAEQYPGAIDAIIEGIGLQDERFLEQGRKLLKQLLKGKGQPASRRARTASAVSNDGAAVPFAAPAAPQSDQKPAYVPPPGAFDPETEDYDFAKQYGG